MFTARLTPQTPNLPQNPQICLFFLSVKVTFRSQNLSGGTPRAPPRYLRARALRQSVYVRDSPPTFILRPGGFRSVHLRTINCLKIFAFFFCFLSVFIYSQWFELKNSRTFAFGFFRDVFGMATLLRKKLTRTKTFSFSNEHFRFGKGSVPCVKRILC